jgi:hypothetical protein
MFEYFGERYKKFSYWRLGGNGDILEEWPVSERGKFIFYTNIYPLLVFVLLGPVVFYSYYYGDRCISDPVYRLFPKFIIEHQSLVKDYDFYYLCFYSFSIYVVFFFILFSFLFAIFINLKSSICCDSEVVWSMISLFFVYFSANTLLPVRIEGSKGEDIPIYLLVFIQFVFGYLASAYAVLSVLLFKKYKKKTRKGKDVW